MTKKKYNSSIMILLVLNFIGILFEIDLTPTYLLLAFSMLIISFISFIILWKKLNYLVDINADIELISSAQKILAKNPYSMVTAILPYILVACINLSLKSFGI